MTPAIGQLKDVLFTDLGEPGPAGLSGAGAFAAAARLFYATHLEGWLLEGREGEWVMIGPGGAEFHPTLDAALSAAENAGGPEHLRCFVDEIRSEIPLDCIW